MVIDIIKKILDWSEVWALIIPLVFLLKYKKHANYLTPVIVYLLLGLIVNCLIDIGYLYKGNIPGWLNPNNYLYNIHSIIRFTCFSHFFILLKHPYQALIKKMLPFIYVLGVINFVFIESFVRESSFSSNLLSAEAGLLLFYCLQFYLYRLNDDHF